jgi:transposase-like protein
LDHQAPIRLGAGDLARGHDRGRAARKHGLTVAEVEDWKERFLSGAENALHSKPLDEEAQKDAQIKRLKQKVGELVMDMDILKEAAKPYLPHPSLRQTSDE